MRRRIIDVLRRTGDRLQISGAPAKRWKPYLEAAHFLKDLEGNLEDLVSSGELGTRLPLSREVARVIDDLIAGRDPGISVPPDHGGNDLSTLEGIPPRWLRLVRERLGVTSRKDLDDMLHAGELRGIDWLPPAVIRRMERALWPRIEEKRWSLGDILPIAQRTLGGLKGVVDGSRLCLTGRLRRGCEWCDGIYLMAGTKLHREVHDSFAELPGIAESTSITPALSRGTTDEGVPVEFRTVEPSSFGASLFFFTGSPEHTQQVKALGKLQQISIRHDRLSRNRVRMTSENEKSVYAAVGLPLIPPELRRGESEVARARAGDLRNLVSSNDIQGDLHVHSSFSDGASSLEKLHHSATKRGYQWLVISDHSTSLSFANGLNPTRLIAKKRIIETLNSRGMGCHLFLGAEVDILPNGSLDYPPDILKEIDVVIAAVHLNLNDSGRAITRRILRALENPAVHVLAHPTCRILGGRPARALDEEAIVGACARYGVALEVNGHAHRMDPPVEFIERALAAGVPLALGSDAHHADQLWMMDLAVIRARCAAAAPPQVINTWTTPRLAEYLHRQRTRTT